MDCTDFDALVSFMIVHQPIPALPVVCGSGEGSAYEEAVASSHDLLANCIRFQMLHAENLSGADMDAMREAKETLLSKLHHNISAVVSPTPSAISDCQLEACYALFCSTARAYQVLYPSLPDLRVRGMDSVCCRDLVHAKTLAHTHAREGMFETCAYDMQLACCKKSSYRDLIRAAVEQQREGPGI